MNRTLRILALVSVLILPFAGAIAAEEQDERVLQVQVNVPPTWRPWLEDDIADVFANRVEEVFRRHGFDGRVERVDPVVDELDEARPLLTINLIEWRIRRSGMIECTFTASLQNGNTVHQFGLYTTSRIRWLNAPGRFGLARAFEDAADTALDDLAEDIARTEPIPGLRR